MSILSTSVKFIRKTAALMLLSLLASSCQWITDDYDDETASSSDTNYIKLTLHVRASAAVTRANPTGGEDGDGREKGIETRENKVDGVTVIFYQNADGINASAASAAATPIDFVAYYETRADGNAYDRYSGELCYTTDEQELDASLDITKTYHILVVANADLTGSITTGNPSATSLATLRDMVLTTVYTPSSISSDASKFVMTSESMEEDVISFHNYSYDKTTNRRIYTFDNIHIERMAARIDFWAKNATYTTTHDHYGYEYPVVGSATDKFVLTSITPFNLNIGTDTGNEYLFKRTDDTAPYLANETLTNWVIDPYTASKTGSTPPPYLQSQLANVVTNWPGTYNVTMSSQQNNKLTEDNSDDIILAYTKENTVTATTPLYYYATGLAFEGYYYRNGSTTGERHVFYYYIRHQGESNQAYTAMKADELSTTATITSLGSSTAMNYGIVRNNIYRVSIERVTMGGWIKIAIEEKPWRHVDNPTIYL